MNRQHYTTIRNIQTVALTSLYLAFWLFVSLHHFLAHEHLHEQKICHAAPGEKHLHNSEYQVVECSICQVVPTVAELPPYTFSTSFIRESFYKASHFGESVFTPECPPTLSQPRAPPA